MTPEAAWDLLPKIEKKRYFRWTPGGNPRMQFWIELRQDGQELQVVTESGRQPRASNFSRFKEFFNRWTAGARTPDEFLRNDQASSMQKIAFYLLPILEDLKSGEQDSLKLQVGPLEQINARPDAVDETLTNEIEVVEQAISPLKTHRRGQGRNLTAPQRKAVELAAMVIAKETLAAAGFTNIEDVSSTHSCDFVAKLNDKPWVVEVKGTTGTGQQILLTAAEFELHRQPNGNNALVVVHGIVLDRTSDTAAGGRAVLYQPWTFAGWQFEAIAYKAKKL